ncbi:MAG: hypothetical protein KGJ89_02075 [Patescibacteria group bacterium]|nr:hypothetical protein [Patescibacteria group bacterium]MDE2015664.1 hypothetical protein [Patescibacteria group bacterium]MDE2226721.1 hypothetical protein [Patescibacteria group bacterium]
MDTDNKDSPIIRRILKESGMPDVALFLSRLSTNDFCSLLMHIYGKRVEKQTSESVIAAFNKKYAYVGTSGLDQRETTRLENLLYEIVPKEFDAIELSPVCPLGTNGALTMISQNNVLSAIRDMEVAADVTIALSMEAARRRAGFMKYDPKNSKEVNICTSERLLRLQPFEPESGFSQHFRCFGMATAASSVPFRNFTIQAATKHLTVYLKLIEELNAGYYDFQDITVYFSDIRIIDRLAETISLDKEEIRRNTQNPDFRLFEKYGISLPAITDNVDTLDQQAVVRYKLERNISFLSEFQNMAFPAMKTMFPWVNFKIDLARVAGIGYYSDFCLHIYARNREGKTFPLADGGSVDWTRKLLRRNKELLFTSGFGSELAQRMFLL